ncbi:DUF2182 domain-containing protein [Bordetella petrii]|uniref:copper chaperone n=1 Tax=Bordetella petrii TaxID=94624 RepID=UPI001E3F2A06|nr:DUF2182 domain-containing protein [Bordetella petrii]MCD0502473.1 DUF2182 domain-containing protein [Bordetella petrii]
MMNTLRLEFWPSVLDALPRCGGAQVSAVWLRMPGQGWPDAAASFLVMWAAMMAAMMLPALMLMLHRHGQARPGWLDWRAATAYFGVWLALGMLVYPLGVMLAQARTQWPAMEPAIPMAPACVTLAAGALQFSRWKARHLAHCLVPHASLPSGPGRRAWRRGAHLGRHCACACAGPTAIMLAQGMSLPVMAALTLAIAAERLPRTGSCSARLAGLAMMAGGLYLLARAALQA